MNNEPVAWMLLGLEDRKPKLINLQVIDHLEGTWIPLYTYEQITPSGFLNASKPIYPAKTLTDEEIEQVRVAIMGTAYWCADENMLEAYNAVKVCCSEVLAILRKAQQK